MTHFPSAQNDWQRAALAFPRHTEPQRAHCTRHRAPTAGGSVITVAPLRVHRIPQPTTSSASHSLGLACFSSRISVRVTHLSPLTHIPVASYIHSPSTYHWSPCHTYFIITRNCFTFQSTNPGILLQGTMSPYPTHLFIDSFQYNFQPHWDLPLIEPCEAFLSSLPPNLPKSAARPISSPPQDSLTPLPLSRQPHPTPIPWDSVAQAEMVLWVQRSISQAPTRETDPVGDI